MTLADILMTGKEIVDGWLEHRFSDPGKYLTFEDLAAAIDDVISQERESCAKIVELNADKSKECEGHIKLIASAIREWTIRPVTEQKPYDVSISIKQWKLTVREFELKLKERDRQVAILEAKVADLRADLRECALALECIRHASPSWSIDFAACEEVLNRRGVQAILKS